MTSSISELYEPLELIGRGTFGLVRKVRHREDGHVLVRKEISYCRMSQREKTQLLAELRILKELKHSNIVQYVHHERVHESEEVHLYMEYCGGGDLSQLIKSCRDAGHFVPERVVWSVLTQLVLALYRCHYGIDPPPLTDIFAPSDGPPPIPSSVILHRDIKPENIFLNAENSVKLGDFGLSKMLDPEHSLATTYVGTPYYMSPEVLLDQPYTPQSDVWSLGCVIYELCALQPPFTGKSHIQLAQKIREGRFAPLPAGYSSSLQRLVSTCLALSPQKRPTTHTLLQSELVRLHRREKEMVEMHQVLRAREEVVSTKEQAFAAREREMTEAILVKREQYENEIRNRLQEELEGMFQEAVENRARELIQMHSSMHIQEQDVATHSQENAGLSTPRSVLHSRHSISDLREAYTVTSPTDIAMSYSPFPNASPIGTFPARPNKTPLRSRLANMTNQGDSSPLSPGMSPTVVKPGQLKSAFSAPIVPTTNGKKRSARSSAVGSKPLSALHENIDNRTQKQGSMNGIGLGAAAARAKIMSNGMDKGIGRTIIDIQRGTERRRATRSPDDDVGSNHVWLSKNRAGDGDMPSPFLRT
ncbi:kinase-like domain-containing protein [Lipomyces arxii]|uniref:kinase-like domain-containing protein n=1 Tax=Lipomyces arxii TaxID=56418 RepID=UPI0034CDF1D2